MPDNATPSRLDIKKYANRRFYDTTRSCHITLGEMHNLIRDGYDMKIMDSTTGEDITNPVLTQIILERDSPKLSIFPAEVLHQIIRTQQQYLGSVVEQFFARAMDAHKSSQEQWLRFMRNTLGLASAGPANPLEWTRTLLEGLIPTKVTSNTDEVRDREFDRGRDAEIAELHKRLADLGRQVERMTGERGRTPEPT
ncbi:MAG: hypothetical protein HOP29_20245 [Phycisphaerales bacterium]|nr:hypothetical protein [Phycisphaerales bacterium]